MRLQHDRPGPGQSEAHGGRHRNECVHGMGRVGPAPTPARRCSCDACMYPLGDSCNTCMLKSPDAGLYRCGGPPSLSWQVPLQNHMLSAGHPHANTNCEVAKYRTQVLGPGGDQVLCVPAPAEHLLRPAGWVSPILIHVSMNMAQMCVPPWP